jgi:type II secretory pathway predicted ATPase ExeA
VVLIIDEAQNLGPTALEELRMLSNINSGKDQLLQLILVGQPQLKDLLRSPELAQFAQRVSSDYHLGALKLNEVIKYIDHRLHVAGAKSLLFSDEACRLVFQASRGIPRIINIVCDTAMVYGFANGSKAIAADIVRNVIEDKQEFGILSFGEEVPPENPGRPMLLKY